MDLDALLSESVGLKQKEKEAKSSKRTANKPVGSSWLNKEEKEALKESVARVSANSEEWQDVAIVLMLSEQHCTTCLSIHTQTEGRFTMKFHPRYKVSNFIRNLFNDNPFNLPKQVRIARTEVDICVNCFASVHSWPANYLE